MSPQDASFLHVENAVSHMHIGSVGIFEGPPPAYDELRAMVESKLYRVPRYRQRVRMVPLELSRPVWVDDEHFNIRYHLRHTSLPRPGSEEQLRNLVGRVMSQQLDRNKPLWEMWIAEGFEDDRWVLLSKTHHCMVDGVSGTDLLTLILDDRRDPERELPEPWEPSGSTSEIGLVRDALRERLTSPYEMARSIRAAFRTPRRLAEVARGLRTFSRLTRDGAASSLNGPIGPHRRWGWTSSTLEAVKAIRKLHGGTVNDVVLSVIARGFRDLLQSRGEEVDGRVVRTLVPVSVRAPGDEGTPNNQVSAMFAELPVGVSDPVERLQALRDQLEDLKERKQAVAADALVALSGFAPPMLLALAARAFSRIPQSSVQTVTTNVPGPRRELYAAGCKLLRTIPYVPLAGRVRIGVAIFSYAGQLNFGVTGDYETCPDLDILCRGIDAGIEELARGV